jgi:hypothetical protein
VTTTPKHYADDPQPSRARAPGWWLPVTRGEFEARMSRLERIALSIDGHVVAVEEIVTYIGEKVSEATDLLAQINDVTNGVATRMQNLIDQLANQSDASPEVLDALRNELALLQGLAADPNNPVPDPGPVGPADPNA